MTGESLGDMLQKVIYALLKAVWVTLPSTCNKLQLKGDFNEQGGKINLFYSAHFKWMQSLWVPLRLPGRSPVHLEVLQRCADQVWVVATWQVVENHCRRLPVLQLEKRITNICGKLYNIRLIEAPLDLAILDMRKRLPTTRSLSFREGGRWNVEKQLTTKSMGKNRPGPKRKLL